MRKQAIIAALIGGLAGAAEAAPMTYSFTGTILGADVPLDVIFAPGQAVTGQFTFEDSGLTFGSASLAVFLGVASGASLTSGDYSATVGVLPGFVIIGSDSEDFFLFRTGIIGSLFGDVIPIDQTLDILLFDASGTAFGPADTVPIPTLSLGSFDFGLGIIAFSLPPPPDSGLGEPALQLQALFLLDSLTREGNGSVTPVPEPAGLGVLGLAFAALLAGLRGRRGR